MAGGGNRQVNNRQGGGRSANPVVQGPNPTAAQSFAAGTRSRRIRAAGGGRNIHVKTAGPGGRGGIVNVKQRKPKKNANKALATARSGVEAAEDDIEQSQGIADEFGGFLDELLGDEQGDQLTEEQINRLTDRAQGIGISAGERSLNQAISAGQAQQRSLVAGAGPGNSIAAARQGSRAAASGTRNIGRQREVVRLQDQFAAQDQLAQALSQDRQGTNQLSGLLAERGINLGQLQGDTISNLVNTDVGRELGLSDIDVSTALGDLQRRNKLEIAGGGAQGTGDLISGIIGGGGALVAGLSTGGFLGGEQGTTKAGGVTGSDPLLNALGFSGGTTGRPSDSDLLGAASGGFNQGGSDPFDITGSDPLLDELGFGGPNSLSGGGF